MKIERIGKKYFETGVKRFYMPFILKEKCKTCGKELIIDLNNDYLYYPSYNQAIEINFYCDDCEKTTCKKIELNIDIKESK